MQKENLTITGRFDREFEGIYRLKVPFHNIFTSVFLIVSDMGRALVDCATTSNEVDTYIVPALYECGLAPKDIDILVLTHRHGDHAGGLERRGQIANHRGL